MALAFFVLLNASAVVSFFKYQRRNLHALEILMYWSAATILFQNYSALFFMNFKTFIIPDTASTELSHLLNRIVLYPMLTLTVLNHYVALTTVRKKVLFFLSSIVLLGSTEGLEHVCGVLIHNGWKIWWSLSFWLLYLLIFLGFMKFFRKRLRKGDSSA